MRMAGGPAFAREIRRRHEGAPPFALLQKVGAGSFPQAPRTILPTLDRFGRSRLAPGEAGKSHSASHVLAEKIGS